MTKKYEIVEGGETLLVTEKKNGEMRYTNRQGDFHRTLGPACEYKDGTKYWYQYGLLHRTDGPAIERADDTKFWYQNDQRHRLDGPAVEYSGGDKFWYQNGLLHRLDGPAVELINGTKAWYIEGEQLTEEEFNNTIPSLNISVSETKQHKCNCPFQVIMSMGCRCGGI